MNRLTNAFSSAIPNASSNSVPLRVSTPPINAKQQSEASLWHARSQDVHIRPIYDDPRRIYFGPNAEASSSAVSMSGVGRVGGDGHKGRSVRCNLGRGEGGKRGWGVSTIPGSGRVTAMAKGSGGKYAIGGGQYLRVLQARTARHDQDSLESIEESVNLWRGNWGVSKSVTDLDWGEHDLNHKLFTTTPSGNILVFDVPRGKIDREILGGHPRPMNVIRACKNASHSSLLLTGGMEGHAKVWDLRRRESGTQLKYYKHSGSITSLAFAPDSPHQFLVGLDNGSIQRYDMRYQYKATGRVFGAHGNKAVMDLKWKDGDNGWLASGGDDRTVQIWDMSQNWDRQPSPIHTLHTSQPVRRLAWRPSHHTELVIVPNPISTTAIDPTIASIPQGLESYQAADEFCEIWDVRRHYIAKYAVPSPDGTPVGLDWWNEDSLLGVFPSAFTSIDISEKILPLESLPRQLMAWNHRGELAYGIDKFNEGEVPFDDPTGALSSHLAYIGKLPKSISDPPYYPLQALGTLSLSDIDEDDFGRLAGQYRLEGSTPMRLCQWNSQVAAECGRYDDARIWTFLEMLIEEFTSETSTVNPFAARINGRTGLPTPTMSPRQTAQDIHMPPSQSVIEPLTLDRIDDSLDDVEELLSSSSSSPSESRKTEQADTATSQPRFMTFAPPTNKQIVELTTRLSTPSSTVTSPPSQPTGKIANRPLLAQAVNNSNLSGRRLSHQQSTGSDSPKDLDYPDPYGVLPFADVPDFAPIPAAVERRGSSSGSNSTPRASMTASRILNGWPDPYGVGGSDPTSRKSASTRDSPKGSSRPSPRLLPQRTSPPMKRVQVLPPAAQSDTPRRFDAGLPWSQVQSRADEYGDAAWAAYRRQRTQPFLDWWQAYVEDGEPQLASTLLVVGKDVVRFPPIQSERIIHSYIELLEAHRLPVEAAYIKKHGHISSIETRASDSGVTHVVHCAYCGRSTGSTDIPTSEGTFWTCKRCKRNARQCVVCHNTVKGLYLGCRRCNHGGHQKCMRLYYLEGDTRSKNTDSQRSISGEKSRHSGETARTSAEMDVSHAEELVKLWTPCPSGSCSCPCRTVVGVVDADTAR